ncbi:MAG TPA: glycine betaine ABC transporter substrate-binding protein [Ilumatobacteraceae bacterium]|nr:glycine betaine ABC transporter substrate-binding protein [Ilumatobacteraceae bacterium]
MTNHSNHRSRAVKLLAPLLVFGLLAAACGSDDDASSSTDAATDTAASASAPAGGEAVDGPTIRLRGQDFSEAITIAEVYGQYLQAKGYDVDIQTPAGFRTEAIDSITNGDLDLIIDYIGGAQAALAPDAPPSANPDDIVAVIAPAFAELGATLLDVSPAVDGDALVVRGDAEATTISELAGLDFVLGAAAQCFERPQCYIGLTDPAGYAITFADTVTLEFGPLLGEALSSSEVDAVIWNTTAPQITAEGFKVLEDDQGLFPAQNIAPIITAALLEAYGDDLAAVINELSAMITTEDLLAWNTETDINLRESDEVATEWLQSKGLI